MMERRGIPLVLATLIGSLTLAVFSAPANADPRNPTDGQIGAAQRAKEQRAKDVGRLQAQIAVASGQIQRLNDSAELAGERYNKAVADYQTAAYKSRQAKAKVVAAQHQVTKARGAVGRF